MDSRKVVLQETGIIALGQCIGVAAMFAVFALIGRFDQTVLFGGIVGTLLSVMNFFMMAINLNTAADKAKTQDMKLGKTMMMGSYMVRLLIIFAVLFVCVKSGACNVFASVIPFLFVRPTITIAEFFRKSGGN